MYSFDKTREKMLPNPAHYLWNEHKLTVLSPMVFQNNDPHFTNQPKKMDTKTPRKATRQIDIHFSEGDLRD